MYSNGKWNLIHLLVSFPISYTYPFSFRLGIFFFLFFIFIEIKYIHINQKTILFDIVHPCFMRKHIHIYKHYNFTHNFDPERQSVFIMIECWFKVVENNKIDFYVVVVQSTLADKNGMIEWDTEHGYRVCDNNECYVW